MYCFFAHHRYASSSTNDILRELARVLGWRHITVHTPDMYGDNLPEFCRTQHPDLLTFSNARWDHREGLPTFRGVHLIRDPRDVLVSSYYSHRESHSLEGWRELQPHRQALQSANKEQGLLLEIDCRAQQFTEMGAWQYNDPRVLEWKMEDLINEPTGHFLQLLKFWDIDVSATSRSDNPLRPVANRLLSGLERRLPIHQLPRWDAKTISTRGLDSLLAKHSFDKKTDGRSPGNADSSHHYRKGAQGDWRLHFTDEVSEQFKGRFGNLLIQLGYEQGFDW